MLDDEFVEVVAVVIERSRSQALFDQDALVGTCAASGIAVMVVDSADDTRVVTAMAALALDLLVVMDGQRPLSPALLATARLGAVALHPSLLPDYSGSDAVTWAIVRGERSTGVTMVRLDGEGRRRNIVAQRALRIGPNDTCASVLSRVDEASAELLVEQLPALIAGVRLPRSEPCGPAAPRLPARTPDMGLIDWASPARMVHDWVRGLTLPFSGAFTTLGRRRVMVWATRLPSPREPVGAPGEVIGFDRGGVRVGVQNGSLVVSRMSYPGNPPAPAGLWCRVSGVDIGTRFDLASADRVAWTRGEGWETSRHDTRSVS